MQDRQRNTRFSQEIPVLFEMKAAYDTFYIFVHSVLVCCGEERDDRKSKAVDLGVDLCPYLHIWPWALGNNWKNKITDTSGGYAFSPKGVLVQLYS